MDDLSYIINQLGEDRGNYFNAVAPPIIQTSNFACNTVEDFRKLILDESSGALYTRGKNPTVQILAKKIAALDGAEEALIFSSGVAAITVPILHLLKQGDHIVSVRNVYSWATKFFTELLPKFGIECTFVDGTDAENYFKAVKPNTKLFYLESPNTYTFELQDIAAISAFAKRKNILTMADNSYCSPLLMKPIRMGVDLCMQSASKYLGGHSDMVAGVLTGSSKLLTPMFKSTYLNIGGIISPDNAWLMIRSLRTMELRLNKICESTKKVVDFLAAHPKIEKVVWPFHASHPQHSLAKKQMKAGAGLFGFVLKTDKVDKIEAFCNLLERFLMAVSWGGHESLLIPICATIPKKEFDTKNEKHRYIRMYIGLEDPDVLIRDLEKSLKSI
ncbi:MAG: trans-sulfuration enzyme family protein [Bacteroidia bacterium]